MGFFMGYHGPDTVNVEVLCADDRGNDVYLTFRTTLRSGERRVHTASVRHLDKYNTLPPKRIERVYLEGNVYMGILKTDRRLIFTVKLEDGTARLVQEKYNTSACRELLNLCE